eukprot:Ihof_evm6s13 gene=Ihof_evmTU6s13
MKSSISRLAPCSGIILKQSSRYFATNVVHPLKICIVGSGPSGFFTAQRLLRRNPTVLIDLLDRLPVPFGLVRFGVAPDHPEVKNVINIFNKVAESNNVRFLGNVDVGKDIRLASLRKKYAAVVLAYGADKDRTLDIAGENLNGVHAARSFVGWYNGHPDHSNLQLDLSGTTAIIIGQGNVALDCARILLSPPEQLQHTDISHHALEALRASRIKRVVCVGRRGPLQAAFTIKELREMTKLPDCKVVFDKSDITLLANQLSMVTARARKRLATLMLTSHDEATTKGPTSKEFLLSFFRSPVEIIRKDGRANGVRFHIMDINGPWDDCHTVPTNYFENIEGTLILRSLGYKSSPLDDSPFDSRTSTVPNVNGVVPETIGGDGEMAPLYCAGWVKRGPKGVILATMNDAYETADAIGSLRIIVEHVALCRSCEPSDSIC